MCWETNKHGSEERGEMVTSSSTLTIKIMVKSELVTEQKFSQMQEEIIVIIKILTSIIKKLKSE